MDKLKGRLYEFFSLGSAARLGKRKLNFNQIYFAEKLTSSHILLAAEGFVRYIEKEKTLCVCYQNYYVTSLHSILCNKWPCLTGAQAHKYSPKKTFC